MVDRQYFDSKADDWDVEDRVERARAIAARLGEQIHLTPVTKALDFGCGTGLLGFALLPMVGHLTLADPSLGMLKVAQLKIGADDRDRVTILQLDEEGVSLPHSYDLIVSLMTLHHIPEPGETIRRLSQHLSPGGVLALADLDSEDGSFHGPEADVHQGFERTDVERWMADGGLENIRASSPWVMTKTVDGIEREYPLFLITGRMAATGGSAPAPEKTEPR